MTSQHRRHNPLIGVLRSDRYAVDSQILLVQSIIATQAAYEFRPSFARGLTIAAYVGMLVGAIFWGLSADIIGRKFAFNTSLMICSIFAIVAGASPNWFVLGLFVCLSAFGSGDDTLFRARDETAGLTDTRRKPCP